MRSTASTVALAFLFTLSLISLTAELWSNDRPLMLRHQGRISFPILRPSRGADFGQPFVRADYKALRMQNGDWAIWPLNAWSPYEINKRAAHFPSAPSSQNVFGTDDRGRDVLARVLYGFRASLGLAVLIWALSALLALVSGGLLAFSGSKIDLLAQRLTEAISMLPQLLVILYLLTIFKPSIWLLVGIYSGLSWMGLSYFVRAEVLRLKGQDFVHAAIALGGSQRHIFLHHILPNCLVPILSFAPFMIIGNLIGLAGLDYLGLGVPPPTPTWGELMAQSQAYIQWAWWLVLFPSLFLFLTVMALSVLGENLRSPRRRPAPILVENSRRERKWLRASAVVALLFLSRPLHAQWAYAAGTLTKFEGEVPAEAILSDKATQFEIKDQTLTQPDLVQRTWHLGLKKNINRAWLGDYGIQTDFNYGDASWIHYTGLRGYARLNARFNPRWNLDMGVGEAFLSHNLSADPHRELLYYSLSLFGRPDPAWEVHASTKQDYVYADWSDASNVKLYTAGRFYNASTDGGIWNRFFVHSSVALAEFDDRNQRRTTESAVLYRVVENPISFKIGPDFSSIGFNNHADYWSPRNFEEFGVRTDLYYNFSPELAGQILFNYGLTHEWGLKNDYSVYEEIKLNYKSSGELTVNLSFVRLGTSNWAQTTLSANLTSPL